MLTAEDLLKKKAKESEPKRNTESLIKRLRAELKRLKTKKYLIMNITSRAVFPEVIFWMQKA